MSTQNKNPSPRLDTGWSGFNILLGIWLIISPFALNFGQLQPAMWNDVMVGIAIALLGFLRVTIGYNRPGWSWWNAVLGIWLVASPFVLRLAGSFAAMWNNIIVGLAVGILAWTSAVVLRARMAIPLHEP